jgi:hypothetical protein
MCAMTHGPIPSATLHVLNDFEDGSQSREVELVGALFELDRRFQYPHYRLRSLPPDLSSLSKSDIKALVDT